MKPTLRALVVLFLSACVPQASGQTAPRARTVGEDVCLDASATRGTAPAGAATGCLGLDLESPGWNAAYELHLCGPCNFSYDDATTRRERSTAGHAHDCCYHARSPGPPLPPGGPRS